MNATAVSRAVSALLVAVALVVPQALAQKQGGTLRVSHRDNPPSASIHEEATISTVMPFMGLFNNLVLFDQTTKQNRLDGIVPDLATAWKWDDTGTKLTFTLRDGVKWHDGKPFTSADVKCTWDMVQGLGENKLRKNPRKPWYFNLKEITTNGEREVTFHLNRPQPSLLAMLAGGMSPVYPCHVSAAQMRTKPVGTGPFKFVDFKQNESIKIARNPDYWKKGRPYLDAIEYTIIANRSTSVLAFISGRFDMTFTAELTRPLMRDVKDKVPSAVCELSPTNTQSNLLVNREKPPFDDPKVRRAMALSIDRASFSQILAEGDDAAGGSMLPLPHGQWGMPAELLRSVPGYDPDVAKNREQGREIMRGLGYGPDKTLKIKVSTRNISSYRDAAVILIDHLKHVHIEAELEPLDTSVWYARMLKKDYSVGMNVQGVGVDDPDVVFYETFGCGSERNYTNYCNKDLEKLFEKQSTMTDLAARKALVAQIDKTLQEDGARPVILHGKAVTCWQAPVKGVNMAVNSIYNHWRFEDVWIDR
ncbi:MAG: ABC transporter substrate-binding protein [Rhodospirillales bacterium]|nr:MAG: ABC transporter substrate-binding protein [Rhodospirillales bacterium]